MTAIDKIIEILLKDLVARNKVKKALESKEANTPQLDHSMVLKIVCTSMRSYGRHPEAVDLIRQSYIEVLGVEYHGNIARFAKDFEITRETVYRHLKNLGIEKEIASCRGDRG